MALIAQFQSWLWYRLHRPLPRSVKSWETTVQPWTYCLVCLCWSVKDTHLQLMLCFEAYVYLNCHFYPNVFYGNSGRARNCILALSSLDLLHGQKQPAAGKSCCLVLWWQYSALPLEVAGTITRQWVHHVWRHPLKCKCHLCIGWLPQEWSAFFVIAKSGLASFPGLFSWRNIVTHTCLNWSSKLNHFLALVPVTLGRHKELPSRVCGI